MLASILVLFPAALLHTLVSAILGRPIVVFGQPSPDR